MQGGHGGFHEVCFGGPAEETGEHFGGESAGGCCGCGARGILILVIGIVVVGLVLDAPFEEGVEPGVHFALGVLIEINCSSGESCRGWMW